METEDQYKIELNACPTPIILVSAVGEIVRTNNRLDVLFGYKANELIGQAVEVLVPTENRDYHPDLRNAFFQVPTTRRMGTGRDLNGVRKDGTMMPVEIGLDPIEFEGQQMVMVSVLDIRERKNSETMIRRALNAASSAMIQVSEDGKIELVNEMAGEMFGYYLDEMVGQPIEILVPEQFRRKHTVYRANYQDDREIRKMGSGRDLFGVRKDGSQFPVEIGLTPIYEANESEGRSTMATVNNITDRKSKERTIAQKTEQLRRLNDELLQFAYSASHDLKAPLSSITGLLEYCKSDLESGNVKEVLANIEKCSVLSSRLATRIEDMLSLAKSDMVSADWEEISVGEQIDNIWTSMDANGVQLKTDFQHFEPFRTVLVRFSVIMENLLSNAIKYRDTRRDENVVSITTRTEFKHFHISVEDNGIGIPSDQLNKVFSLFKRVSNTSEPGSGIGLALAKKNATHLRGTISLESSNGATTFTVSLPQQDTITEETES